MAMMNAMRGDLYTMNTRMERLEARYGLTTPIVPLQTTTPQATQQSTQEATDSTPPAPQEAKKEEDKKPLYQATVEDVTESTAEKETEQQYGSSKLSSDKPDSKTTLSTIPRLCTARSFGDPAVCLSNAFFAYLNAPHLAYQHALILGLMLTTPLGYIECTEGMEATGQG